MKTLIIGGGMAGLTYGILAAKHGQVVLCERNSRVGKKISVSGNGKCNLGNTFVDATCYNKSKIVQTVLNAVTVQDYLNFLQSCGIYTFADSVGRIYPLSESASNVVDCMRFAFAQLGGQTRCDCFVRSVQNVGKSYLVHCDGGNETFDQVVVACGSGSSVQNYCVDGLIDKAYFTPRVPSLVPVKANVERVLSGLRAKANVSLVADGDVVATESGEVQFRDFGLSGICVFNLSAIIARDLVLGKRKNYVFVLDLVPTMSQLQLTQILNQRVGRVPKQNYFYGILHNKIAECIVKRSADDPKSLAQNAKQFCCEFQKLCDFSASQVTAGGIDQKFVDENLCLPNGVVVLGEILNVDGICGGYNLFFAAASAIYAFQRSKTHA